MSCKMICQGSWNPRSFRSNLFANVKFHNTDIESARRKPLYNLSKIKK